MKKYFLILLICVPLLAACTAAKELVLPKPTETATTIPVESTATEAPTATLLPSSTPGPTSTAMATLAPLPTITRTPAPYPTPAKTVSRGDMHMHTTCSDGTGSFEDMVQVALAYNYDFISITDHHQCRDVKLACLDEERLLCIPGEEVPAAHNLDILAIGVKKNIRPLQSIKDTVLLIHQEGGIAIAAHPWAYEQTYSKDELLNSGLDAMECPPDGSNPFAFDTRSLPCVFDSDAHEKWAIDPSRSTVCNGEIKSLWDLKNAILDRLCFRGLPEDDGKTGTPSPTGVPTP
jgi:predicted metal-dependent phosphoesterase TrpH